MKNRTRYIAFVVVVLGLAAVPFVYAQQPHGPRDGGPREGGELGAIGALMHAREELNLSDAQVTQIKGIFQALREQNEPYRDQLRGGMESITSTLLANPNDLASAQAQLDKQQALERTMKVNALTAASKALNVLTPEQRTKLTQLIAEHKERRASRRSGEGFGRRRGGNFGRGGFGRGGFGPGFLRR
jgi:Spy/CpxP family protein refolding chaperone